MNKQLVGFFIFSFLFLCKSSEAQKEDHQWIYNFSNSFFSEPGDTWGTSIIDFNELPPLVYEKPELTLSFKETNASICDDMGQLYLYSNGQEIRGADHLPITNGDTINFGARWITFTDVEPAGQTTGFRGIQEIGFIPQPDTDTTLVLYQHGFMNEIEQLWMAKIVEEGTGPRVVSKDEVINSSHHIDGKITACRHGNGRDWWLLQFSHDTVYNYLIDPNGIHLDGIQILPVSLGYVGFGQAKYSPDGNKFASVGFFDLNNSEGIDFLLADFDRCSGRLSNIRHDYLPADNNPMKGLEFSPDGQLIYVSLGLHIRQYDLMATDFFSSYDIVAEHNGINNCSIDNGPNPKKFGQMQRAPDNQIYVSLSVQCNDVHIIRHPNVRGPDCEVEQNAIILPTFVMGTIPNTNTYRLGPLDGSSCDTLGLDNNPISRFWYEQDSMDYLSVPFWDVSYFRPEEWAWTFGDGSSSSERHPVHDYSEKGVYEVCLTVSNENSNHTSCQTLYLGVSDTDDLEDNISLSVFPNPTEGLTRFLLQDYLPESGVLSLYDIEGRLVLTQPMRTGATVVDLSGLGSGTYVYELRDGRVRIGGGKVIRY